MSSEKSEIATVFSTPPAYVSATNPKAWTKRAVFVTVYAAAVTVTLVVVLIAGIIYIHEKSNGIKSTKLIEIDTGGENDEIPIHNTLEVDHDLQEATILIQDPMFGNLSTIGVLNHKTGVAGFYFPGERKCIVGNGAYGVLSGVFKTQETEMEEFHHDKQIEIKADLTQIGKLEDLPLKLWGLCEHHPIYLAVISYEDYGSHDKHSINKRDACQLGCCCCPCYCTCQWRRYCKDLNCPHVLC